MNGINRRGQKVVCVLEIEITGKNCRVWQGPHPKIDAIYTVEDFIDNGSIMGVATVNTDIEIGPAVSLYEIPCIKATKRGEAIMLGWPICCFRPVSERKTDISDIVRIGRDVRQPEDA